MLLIAIMLMGAGTTWAADKTITLDYNSFGLTTYKVYSATVGGFDFTVDEGYKGNNNTIQMNSSRGNGILYNTTPITGLKSITVNVYTGSKTYTITTGKSEKPTANSQTGSTTGTYNAASSDTYFQLKVSGASYFSSIVITYDDAGSSSNLQDNDLALTGAPIELNFDLYDNSSAQVIYYTTSSTGAVTVNSSDYINAVVDEDDMSITVTPTAVTPSAQTITVNQEADDYYSAGSVTFTVVVDDSTPLPTYTVTLGDDNSTLTETTNGAGITLPARNDINDYAFVGWSETNVSTETTTAPTIIPAGAYSPTADITLYPIYTKTEGGGGTTNKTENVTISDYASANKWDNGTAYQPLIMDENISIGGTVSGNNFKYYTSDNSWRFYTGGAFTISAANNATLISVTLTFSAGTLSYNNNNITSGTAFDVTGSSAIISCSANAKITAISVSYAISGGGTTYYWSSPVAAAVERPVITLAENPFMFSTTATITCATVGASILFSYDGDSWQGYENPIIVNATTTIYAKAIKDSEESAVASVIATKNLAEPTITIDATGITNNNIFEGEEAGSLSASVTYNGEPITGATVTWSGNNDEVATIDASTGTVTLVAAGSVTFTATYAGNDDYSEISAPYEMTVIYNDPNANDGSAEKPYTVAEAIAYINTLGSNQSANEVYVSGIISQVDSYNSKYNSITYWISDDGTTTNQMEVYSGKGLNKADFSAVTDLAVGDIVTVKGYVKMYQSTPEFVQNNQLVSYVGTPKLTIDPGTAEPFTYEEGGDVADER